MFEKIRVPTPPVNVEFTLLRLRSSRSMPFSSHWILAIPPSLRLIGDRQVKEVDPLSLTAATSIGGLIITPSKMNQTVKFIKLDLLYDKLIKIWGI